MKQLQANHKVVIYHTTLVAVESRCVRLHRHQHGHSDGEQLVA